MRKKLTALFLCLSMGLTPVLLASCAAENDQPRETVNLQNGDPNAEYNLTDLPKVDMGGTTIGFCIAETDGDGFHLRSIRSDDEESEDTVDIAVRERNAKIEAYFNCFIEVVDYIPGGLNKTIQSQLLAGVPEYDILGARQYDDVQLALRGIVYDLSKLEADYPEAAGYMNLDAPYWPQTYNNGLQVGNGRYWVTGDLCLRYSGGYYCYFVNHILYNELLMDDYGNVYDLVREGKWSLDLLTQMSAACWEDTDGDEKTSTGDRLAIAQPVHDNTNGLAVSSGVMFSYRHPDGSIELTFHTGNTQLISFMEKFYNLLSTQGVHDYGDNMPGALMKFAASEAVFAGGRLNQAELYLQEMEDNYGILPNPKLNEAQTAYYSSIHDGVSLYGINNASEQIPYAALVLEAMEMESRKTVRPVYFDSAVKIKYSRGGDDADMINLMDSTAYSDFVYVWQFSKEMNGMGGWLRNNISAKGSTALRRVQDSWRTGLTEIMTGIEKLENASE